MKSKLKKSLSLLLALVMVLSCMSVGVFADATDYWTDEGNYDASWLGVYDNTSSYTIADAADLAAFAVAVNSGKTFKDKTVTLTAASIDLSDHYWTPIGTNTTPFSGVFDGQNHTISNLTISAENSAALFGYIKGTASSFTSTSKLNSFYDSNYNVNLPNETIFGCEVKDLTVSGASLTASSKYAAVVATCFDATVKGVTVTNSTIAADKCAGGVVAYVPDGAAAFIDHCTTGNDVSVNATTYHAAGILARVNDTLSRVIISNCTNGATITSADVNAAGIAGQAKNTLFYSCENKGNINGKWRAAGITTDSSGSAIIGCTNSGRIYTDSAKMDSADDSKGVSSYSTAGIYAYAAGSGTNVVVNCTNSGNVTGNCVYPAIVSGIIGGAASDDDAIQGCVNTGTLTNSGDGKVYDVSSLSSIETASGATTLDAINSALSADNKNVKFTDSFTLTENDAVKPINQEIVTFANSPNYLTLDLSSITTSSLKVNVSNTQITVTGNSAKNDLTLNIVGTGNTITYASGNILTLNQLGVYETGSATSNVTVSAGLKKLTLAGTGTVEATVEANTTIDQVSFATAGGTYTLNNYGKISHTQSDSNQYRNEHTVSAVVNCTVTVNNYGTIEALANENGVYSYAVLLYCTTATVNQHPGSTIIAEADFYKIIYGEGTNGSTNVMPVVDYYGKITELGASYSDAMTLKFFVTLTKEVSDPQFTVTRDADSKKLTRVTSENAFLTAKESVYLVTNLGEGSYEIRVKLFAMWLSSPVTLRMFDGDTAGEALKLRGYNYSAAEVTREDGTDMSYSMLDYLKIMKTWQSSDTRYSSMYDAIKAYGEAGAQWRS